MKFLGTVLERVFASENECTKEGTKNWDGFWVRDYFI